MCSLRWKMPKKLPHKKTTFLNMGNAYPSNAKTEKDNLLLSLDFSPLPVPRVKPQGPTRKKKTRSIVLAQQYKINSIFFFLMVLDDLVAKKRIEKVPISREKKKGQKKKRDEGAATQTFDFFFRSLRAPK